ncbi:lysine histidine transporter-like 8 [Bidens hawaiensis]|uniref:lysine histidine transporter-like 8 n=1 Tax=Bidens hawaiensis TaxID=980011 RepID=UPI004049DCDA
MAPESAIKGRLLGSFLEMRRSSQNDWVRACSETELSLPTRELVKFQIFFFQNLDTIGSEINNRITCFKNMQAFWFPSAPFAPATMPTSKAHPSQVPMWKGIKFSYTLIALCLFPLAIGGYWAYGHLIPLSGMLTALFVYHSQDVAKSILGLASILVIFNALSSFQIYGMPTFDELESLYVRKFKKACTWWQRMIIRTGFGFTCFFIAVAIPFLSNLAGLIGGIALPVTLAYPCFMWIKIKKPKVYSPVWWLHWGLGILGMMLSGLLISAGIYVVIHDGVKLNFFKPV